MWGVRFNIFLVLVIYVSFSDSKDSKEVVLNSNQMKNSKLDSLKLAIKKIHQRSKRDEYSENHHPYSSHSSLPPSHRYRYPLYKKSSLYSSLDDDERMPFYSDLQTPDYPNYYYDMDYEEPKPSSFRERSRKPVSLISNAHFSNKRGKGVGYYYDMDYEEPKPSSFRDRSRKPVSLISNAHFSNKRGKSVGYYRRLFNLDDSPYDFDTRFYQQGNRVHAGQDTNRYKREADLSFPNRPPTTEFDSKINLSNKTKNNSDISTSNKMVLKQRDEIDQINRIKRAFSYIYNNGENLQDDDFLTREYFKTIARAVGNKRKRMINALPEKRNVDFNLLVKNPSMLHYIQDQLKDAEEKVAMDAEKVLESNLDGKSLKDHSNSDINSFIGASVDKLDAFEKILDGLNQLERIEQEDKIMKRAVNLADGGDWRSKIEIEKRRKSLKARREGRVKKRNEILDDLFGHNTKAECPVMDKIVLNCGSVNQIVGDETELFLEPCVKHEICYLCGAGLQISRHECDALLSSALEAGCSEPPMVIGSASLECLSVAGETFNSLSNPTRYDDKGTCTYDPCIRKLLDSR